jgi:hypothetical protein
MSRPPPSEDVHEDSLLPPRSSSPTVVSFRLGGFSWKWKRILMRVASSLGGGLLMRIPTCRRSASSCAFSLGGSLHPHAHSHLTTVYALPPVTGFFTWKKLEQDVCRRGTWRRLYLSALVHVSSSLFDLTRGATTSLECPSLCILLLS